MIKASEDDIDRAFRKWFNEQTNGEEDVLNSVYRPLRLAFIAGIGWGLQQLRKELPDDSG